MRRVFLAGSFVALVAVLGMLWAHRYERAAGLPVWRLEDLRQGAPAVAGVEWAGTPDQPLLRLKVAAGNPPVALRLAIPGAPAVEMLQLHFSMTARGLTPGAKPWETGRIMIEWFPPDGAGEVEEDPVGGVSLDEQNDPLTLVAGPVHGPAVPALRLEHLGRAGEFEIAGLEITAVQERNLWKTGRWFLAFGWLVWAFACIRSWPGISWWRALGAAAIWLLMGIHFAIPGPWKIQRPLGVQFRLGGIPPAPPSGQAPPSVKPLAPVRITSGAIPVAGNLTVRGSLPLRIRLVLAKARPLLHVLLLFGPVLVLVWLAGRRVALVAAISLALAIEGGQVAFGYGFDWIDIFDLAFDAAGIVLGIRAYGKIQGMRASRARS